ncbi:M23 family metallopeptidase [Psychroserpens sp.]|uniref:M23 family metallopeptidase n=1 Tax=Psychroserpens sp. TaxID=2020870 RepID=UPI003C725491
MKFSILNLILCLLLASCQQVQKVTDAIVNPSAKEVFERQFKNNDLLLEHYQARYEKAKQNTLVLELPSSITSSVDSSDFKILAYTIELSRGERFKMVSNLEPNNLQLAIDVFQFQSDSVVSKKPQHYNEPGTNALSFDVVETKAYKIVIIVDSKLALDFSLIFSTEPSFNFPVSGKDNAAIQSFWGAARGGGTRSHKGIDIFAKRGTPAVASTDGFISNTGNRGLGGKQVWLRDGIFGQSLYYAHLDSIAVSAGSRVKRGDTLGYVGNTGNARTTSPHLHFGIYTRSGAVDPLPFVKIQKPVSFDEAKIYFEGKTRLKINELRVGAGVKNQKVQDLDAAVEVEVLARTNRWLHLKINDSLEGFMHESLVFEVKPISSGNSTESEL